MEELERIHPSKRKQVAACIEIAQRHPKIRKMIIFGSSIREDCTEESDVDICLSIEGETRGLDVHLLALEINKACEYNCDILTLEKLNGRIKEIIVSKGVVVYERIENQ